MDKKDGFMPNRAVLSLLRLFGHQNWIAAGLRNRIIRYFIDPHTVESTKFETNYFGLRYQGNLNSIIDWYIYFYGWPERSVLLLMRDLVKKKLSPIFIDVGANVGSHSLFMSKFCSQVHAFEPYEKVRENLLENIKINNIKNIFVHNIGLGSKEEYLDYYAPVDSNQGEGSFLADHKTDNILIGKLKIVKGDSYLSELQLKNVDLIKIDVEGFENEVLIGLKETIKKHLPFIVMEYSLTTRKRLSLLGLKQILPQGYTIKEIYENRKFLMIFKRLTYNLLDIDFKKVCGMELLLSPPPKS